MYPPISKQGPYRPPRPPNMADYARERRDFNWNRERARLAGATAEQLNIGVQALDRPVQRGLGGRLAVRFLGRDSTRTDYSYDALLGAANRCANVLAQLGVLRGERVFSLLGRGPALHTMALGALRSGLVFCPLFSAFGPEPVRTRLELGSARVLVTTDALYERKVAPIRASLTELRHVLIVRSGSAALPADTLDLDALLAAAAATFTPVATAPEDPALLHFTSGTTGQPKGVLHVHAAVVAHLVSARLALDLQADDRYWCTADPGWVTGMAYGVIAPLVAGVTSIVDQEEFDPQRWYRLLAEERISVWYTAPTAIRMLMKAGTELVRAHAYPALRFLASVGEPLNPEAVLWGCEAFHMPFHDNWWQTETGGIMIANFAAVDIKPGSMGLPLPGIEAAIIRRSDDGGGEVVAEPDVVGELALRRGWPSMFRGYLDNEAKYRSCFIGEWYLTGDLARRDADGYYWFVGRSDDVIKAAGHLISPFEVESALMTHPAVVECAITGVPDEIRGQVVKATVVLAKDYKDKAGDALAKELQDHVKRVTAPYKYPRVIEFADELPKTISGKIRRVEIRRKDNQ